MIHFSKLVHKILRVRDILLILISLFCGFPDNEIATICILDQMKELNTLGTTSLATNFVLAYV